MTSFRFRTLAELCDLSIASVNPRSNPTNEFWYVDISAVDNNTKRITAPQRIRGEQASVRARQSICRDDILVATTRPNLNAVAKVPSEYDGEVCSTGFCVLRSNEELDPDYLFSFVQSAAFINPLDDLTKGALYPAVTDKQVLNQVIRWVPVEEQRVIANSLNKQLAEVEMARQAAETLLGDVALLPSRIINEVFNEIGGQPSTVAEILVDIQAGKSFQTAETLAEPDEMGVLKVSAVTWTDFRPNEAKALRSLYDPADSHKVKNGDFIISRANTKEFVGAVVLVDRDYPNRLLSDKTLRLVVDETRVCKEFLLFALRTSAARRHIEHFATGTSDSMRNISQGTIISIPLCLPGLNEQRRLATQLKVRLKEVTEVRSAIEMQLQEIEVLPNRILAQVFES